MKSQQRLPPDSPVKEKKISKTRQKKEPTGKGQRSPTTLTQPVHVHLLRLSRTFICKEGTVLFLVNRSDRSKISHQESPQDGSRHTTTPHMVRGTGRRVRQEGPSDQCPSLTSPMNVWFLVLCGEEFVTDERRPQVHSDERRGLEWDESRIITLNIKEDCRGFKKILYLSESKRKIQKVNHLQLYPETWIHSNKTKGTLNCGKSTGRMRHDTYGPGVDSGCLSIGCLSVQTGQQYRQRRTTKPNVGMRFVCIFLNSGITSGVLSLLSPQERSISRDYYIHGRE